MSTTSPLTDSTPTTDSTDIDPADHTLGTNTSHDRRTRTGAPQMFSPTNRKPLPPAFEDEPWATGDP